MNNDCDDAKLRAKETIRRIEERKDETNENIKKYLDSYSDAELVEIFRYAQERGRLHEWCIAIMIRRKPLFFEIIYKNATSITSLVETVYSMYEHFTEPQ
jgi:hypothetical protein